MLGAKKKLTIKASIYSLAIVALAACAPGKAAETETDIFISPLDTSFSAGGKLNLADSNQRIYFSKDFWNYFIRTHPQATASIFIGSLHNQCVFYRSPHLHTG